MKGRLRPLIVVDWPLQKVMLWDGLFQSPLLQRDVQIFVLRWIVVHVDFYIIPRSIDLKKTILSSIKCLKRIILKFNIFRDAKINAVKFKKMILRGSREMAINFRLTFYCGSLNYIFKSTSDQCSLRSYLSKYWMLIIC